LNHRDPEAKAKLLALVKGLTEEEPDITLREISEHLASLGHRAKNGVNFSEMQISRFLHGDERHRNREKSPLPSST
jgi:hypothetical protein